MKKTEIQIVALSDSTSSPGNYVLILEEVKGNRRIPVIIGALEAQAIAVALEQMQPTRPLTHDLFRNVLETLGFQLKEVVIQRLENQIFYATLEGVDATGKHHSIDARTSDAIALAIRFLCPIYTLPEVIQKVGVLHEKPSESFSNKRTFKDYTLEELEQLLQQVLAKEDYESATKIRDVIERRKKG